MAKKIGTRRRGFNRKGRIDWDGIKQDYCSGDLSVKEIAMKWRVKTSTLRSEASRNKWPTPKRFFDKMKEAAEIAQTVASQGLNGLGVQGSLEQMTMAGITPTEAIERAQEAGTLGQVAGAAQSLDGLEYQRQMAQFACLLASKGIARMSPPKNWREMATADTIARRALGLDSKGGGAAGALIRISPGPGGIVDIAAMAQGDAGAEEWHPELDEDDD